MSRQLQDSERMQTLTVRLPSRMFADIDAYQAHLKAQHPAFKIERGEAVRDLLLKALALVGDRGPVEAPVTLGADQTADQSPSIADQSLQKAARDRTTVRQGRKRQAAAAKG